MTTWSLTLRVDRLDEGESTPVTEAAIASLSSPDPRTVAAVLRATADQLDPPRPVYRSAADRREAADQRFREKLAGYGDQPSGVTRGWTSTTGPLSGNAYDARCRGNDCAEGHTYLAGCLLANVADRYQDGRDSTMGPSARQATSAQIDAMVCPDCIGDRHTHQPGRCALPPPWNGVSVLDTRRGTRAGACDQPGHGTTGCDCLPVVVDDPGDRMDVPDAVLSASAAEAVARVAQDEAELMARMRQGGHGRGKGPLMSTRRERRPGRTVETDLDRAAKTDGCGPVHTHTGSCAYTVVERINPDA